MAKSCKLKKESCNLQFVYVITQDSVNVHTPLCEHVNLRELRFGVLIAGRCTSTFPHFLDASFIPVLVVTLHILPLLPDTTAVTQHTSFHSFKPVVASYNLSCSIMSVAGEVISLLGVIIILYTYMSAKYN